LPQIRGKPLEILISDKQIKEKVKELGKQISEDFKGEDLLVIGILKGSFMFFAALLEK